ncbi:MAG TPA: AAA family ATPase [Pirellulales bacterium]|nr:AAA family ATPase [Pirellulales bacterium]
MINRVYIDNFKCFVNFECRPQSLQLLLGDNGTGKTTLFDVLETLRDFVCTGTELMTAFPSNTLTAWDNRAEQRFELGMAGNGGEYVYRLVVEHDRAGPRNRIKAERLEFDGQPLYEFDGHEAHLYRDDFSPGPVFPFDWSRSAIPTIPERGDNQSLSWFRRQLRKVYVFSPDPLRMLTRSEAELDKPDRELHDLVSWLRHLSQESVDTVSRLRDVLRDEVIEGLDNMKLEKVSEATRALKFEFKFASKGNGRAFSLLFDQLSTGQRNLVALFAILHAAVEKDATVCIDEPDNYVALRELQPWLTLVRDRVEDEDGQCLLISHHPELINYLAAQHGLRFFREEMGPTRAQPFDGKTDELIAPAEIVARGWDQT